MPQPATFRRVKYLVLLSLLALTGCQTRYTHLIVTDHTGGRLSSWTAEGRIKKHELGYRVKAVERTSGGTNPVTSRYPNGFSTIVVGPNILLEDVEKPAWLVELDEHHHSHELEVTAK